MDIKYSEADNDNNVEGREHFVQDVESEENNVDVVIIETAMFCIPPSPTSSGAPGDRECST